MILHPAVLAILAASFAALAAVAGGSGVAVDVLRRWDLGSGARTQLLLERRTYLASAFLRWACLLELTSLLLFVHTADAVAPLFAGAMCAAGTLRAAPWGYAALGAKLLAFVAAGVWLIVNHADAQAWDHPLVRPKSALALLLLPIAAADAALTLAFFRGLEPEVITSCCGSLFGAGGRGLGADLAGLPAVPTAGVAVAIGGAAVGAALALRRSGRGAGVLGLLGAASLPVGVAAVIAFVSPFVYEQPNHHCPFCLLKPEYGFVGYAAYVPLLGGSVAAIGAGVLGRWGRAPSLAETLPRVRRVLATAAAAGIGAFLVVGGWAVLRSTLRP